MVIKNENRRVKDGPSPPGIPNNQNEEDDYNPPKIGHNQGPAFDLEDPTKNVENLVRAGEKTAAIIRAADQRFLDAQLLAQEKLQNFAREADAKICNFARDSSDKLNKALLDAETRRLDQLASTRQEYQNTIRDMLAESVRTTSTLVSTQLVQIQATFDTRVSKLEAAAFTQAGARAVADPQISDAITRLIAGQSSMRTDMDATIAKITASNAEAMAKIAATISEVGKTGEKTVNQKTGQNQMIGWIVAGIMLLAAIASPIIALMAKSQPPPTNNIGELRTPAR